MGLESESGFSKYHHLLNRSHINAFNYFKGVPETVKIDNSKAALLEANFYEPIYQSQYKNLADYYDLAVLHKS